MVAVDIKRGIEFCEYCKKIFWANGDYEMDYDEFGDHRCPGMPDEDDLLKVQKDDDPMLAIHKSLFKALSVKWLDYETLQPTIPEVPDKNEE